MPCGMEVGLSAESPLAERMVAMKLLLQVECLDCATFFVVELKELGLGMPLDCPHCLRQRQFSREETWRMLRRLNEELRVVSSARLAATGGAGAGRQIRVANH